MSLIYRYLLKPVLFTLDAETAHNAVFRMASEVQKVDAFLNAGKFMFGNIPANLHQNIFGLTFHGPVGLAAGFDKNGHLTRILSRSGFGFLEIGSITAIPSGGNTKPRLFRLPEDGALINRMGLNNDGADMITERLAAADREIPVGINIAKSHDSRITGGSAVDDYLYSYKKALKAADYITINISCPNTSDGRTFESAEPLNQLLLAITSVEYERRIPVLVKFSADIETNQLRELLAISESFDIDGYVAVNTSSSRSRLKSSDRVVESCGMGGLSGLPIRARALRILSEIRDYTGGRKPLIGVGGIMSASDAVERMRAGAWLLQTYTGLIYNGPGFVRDLNHGISRELDHLGLDNTEALRKLA
jgi:dihydroorotate dehydrogenase